MRERVILRAAKRALGEERATRVFRSFDFIGDIAIIKLPSDLEDEGRVLAEEILKELPYIKAVLRQSSPVQGSYRMRALEPLAGEKRMVTLYREHGCAFKVDLSQVYFSPRLSHERLRVSELVRDGEIVINMFAGVGCFSVMIAKRKPNCLVYSIDVNPKAVDLMRENAALNGVEGRVVSIEGDAREVLRASWARRIGSSCRSLRSPTSTWTQPCCR